VDVRDLKLKTMKSHMDADPAVRIQYAAKYAQTANYWKYYIGQSKGLKALDVYGKKKALEDEFSAWMDGNADREALYGETLGLLDEYYANTDATVKGQVYSLEAGLIGCDLMLFAFRVGMGAQGLFSEDADRADGAAAALQGRADGFFKDYDQETDRDLFIQLMTKYMTDIAPDQHPAFFATVRDKYKGDFARYADKMYPKSFLTDPVRFKEFLADPDQKALDKDLAVAAAMSLIDTYRGYFASPEQSKFDKGYRLLTAGLREMKPEKMWYPDANSTMRLSYGQVGDYDPADAVHYDFVTTANGILQKKDNSNPEFVVDPTLETLIRNQDYGRYADENGDLVLCFISGNDITGGNSGSPVLNGNGDLIGLAFDGNWEAMSGDIAFEPELQRTISVDIRYVMWVIDKMAGAQNLIDEIDFVTTPKPMPAADEAAPAVEEGR
ncbi:MAG: S46 family peptidase, partial [Bacteroidota bacterium]|nr:S46 family peptidase [Bacteroidota bacterium]